VLRHVTRRPAAILALTFILLLLLWGTGFNRNGAMLGSVSDMLGFALSDFLLRGALDCQTNPLVFSERSFMPR
jgi:hypothetical protein